MGDELDPFGRRKGENPLASLGWDGDETASTLAPQPQPQPAPQPAPAAGGGWVAPQPQPQPPPRSEPAAPVHEPWRDAHGDDRPAAPPLRRPSRRPPVARVLRAVIMLAVVVAVLGGVIGTLVDRGVQRADRFVRDLAPPDPQSPGRPAVRERTGESSRSGRLRPAQPARGLSVSSLLRPAAFGRALARLRNGGYGRLTQLRVAPDRIDATTLTKGGALRLLQIAPGGALSVLQRAPGGFTGAPTMTLKGIDAAAPNRLTRSAAGRLGQPASRVDYLVLTEFAGARQWNVYFKGGPIFSADAHGRITRRVS